jgi:hypothetical protein
MMGHILVFHGFRCQHADKANKDFASSIHFVFRGAVAQHFYCQHARDAYSLRVLDAKQLATPHGLEFRQAFVDDSGGGARLSLKKPLFKGYWREPAAEVQLCRRRRSISISGASVAECIHCV